MKKNIKTIIILVVLLAISIASIKPIISKIKFGLDLKGGFEILYLVEPLNDNDKLSSDMLMNTYKSIEKRIDTLGVSEPEISVEGEKIRIKLPGVKDETTARERLSTPAVLSFRDTSNNLLMTSAVLGGSAKLDYDDKKNPVVALNIKDNDTFYKVTKDLSTRSDNLMVMWLDFVEGTDSYENEKNLCGTSESNCISAATVSEAFNSNVIIKGHFTRDEAQNLVDLINSGSLPTKLTEISTNTVDASFGSHTLKNLAIAGIITIAFISILMTAYYRLSGFVSSVCLVVYAVLIFLTFTLIGGVLTITGIAALVLGIGMSIDSCIITLERIKEEIRNKKSLKVAYKDGTKKALVSLMDSSITTLLAATILFIYGESSVKGFSTMLIITVVTTFIVMIYLNKFILGRLVSSDYYNNNTKALIGVVKPLKDRVFTNISKIYTYIISIFVILGITFTLIFGINKGIDFMGGTSINILSTEKISDEYISNLLKNKTILSTDITETQTHIKIRETLNQTEIKQVQNTLYQDGYSADVNVISNMVKKDLTNNAIKALLYASIGIFIYIMLRFTPSFAISSIASLGINVAIVISLFSIFKIEINFIFIASILTIIGYSINDTIVIFDLIRENLKNDKTKKINEKLNVIVNNSIKMAFTRNMLTSITTVSSIIILLIIGTSGLYEFNIALLIGLCFGTFTSLFISTYIWKICENIRQKRPKKIDNEPEERIIKGINA